MTNQPECVYYKPARSIERGDVLLKGGLVLWVTTRSGGSVHVTTIGRGTHRLPRDMQVPMVRLPQLSEPEAWRTVVADVRRSYPDMGESEAVAHALQTVNLGSLDYLSPTAAAYHTLLVASGEGRTVIPGALGNAPMLIVKRLIEQRVLTVALYEDCVEVCGGVDSDDVVLTVPGAFERDDVAHWLGVVPEFVITEHHLSP